MSPLLTDALPVEVAHGAVHKPTEGLFADTVRVTSKASFFGSRRR